jgi:pimeloyl-ACP methyl ester carboxylesterase
LWTTTQLQRSWYIFFFQLPWLPEWVIRAGNFAGLERSFRQEPVRPGTFSDEDIQLYKQALARPGALTAALNYYRAVFRYDRKEIHRTVGPIQVPTLLIWGERDRYLGTRLTQGLEAWVPNLQVCRLASASHWVQNDAPDEVNRLIIEFLRNEHNLRS